MACIPGSSAVRDDMGISLLLNLTSMCPVSSWHYTVQRSSGSAYSIVRVHANGYPCGAILGLCWQYCLAALH